MKRMKINKKTLIYIAVGAIALVGVVIFMKKRKRTALPPPAAIAPTAIPTTTKNRAFNPSLTPSAEREANVPIITAGKLGQAYRGRRRRFI